MCYNLYMICTNTWWQRSATFYWPNRIGMLSLIWWQNQIQLRNSTSYDVDMSNDRGVLTVRSDASDRQILRQRTLIVTNDVTRPLLCVRITCYVTVITHDHCYARVYILKVVYSELLCNSYNRITVEINRCSFRSVRFALLYIVTRSKIV
jgi:hypothetical protein